ncbi:MAG: TonB-dependent receptor [Deltaproteobacteria bacterium]|nr:TonB-dependent receptor [Deltaproteobacteria bacterium]
MSRFPIVCIVLAASSASIAQSTTTGAISGRVVDAGSKEPLVGLTVTIQNEAGGDPQTTFTDSDGGYKITELVPGTYSVTFVDDTASVKKTGIRVGANDNVPVFQAMKRGDVIVLEGKAPQLKLSKTDLSIKIDKDFLLHMPLTGRTVESAAGTKAGVHNDGVGLAFSGSTALENRFLVDGIDITGLTLGNVGTPVLNNFVEEIEVLSGGYNAEWGRAIGGIVNIVTKTGTNKFQGGIFATYAPGFLAAGRQTTPANASSIDVVGDRAYSADFGVELGGPIIKDRLWFYAGLAPQFGRTDFTRVTRSQTDCRQLLPNGQLSDCDPRLITQGGHADANPDVDPVTGFFITDEIDRDVRASTSRGLSSIAKLNLAVSADHQAQLSAIVVPGQSRSPGLFGLPSSGQRSNSLTWDTAARWTSKLDDAKLELEAVLAWHHSQLRTGALDAALDAQPRQVLRNGNLATWSALGGESALTASGCTDGFGTNDRFPAVTNCPMETVPYVIGGPGAVAHDSEDRRSARFSVTRRARLVGTHEFKAGIDIDDNSKVAARLFSGGAFIENFVGPGVIDVTRWVALAPMTNGPTTDPRFDRTCTTPSTDGSAGGGEASFMCDYLPGTVGAPGTEVSGQTIDWSVYLRDSWQPVSNLTLNAGVRYEEQRLRYAEELRNKEDPLTGNRLGKTAMNLENNWAPRLGVVWDPTKVGESKVWASYGRFFEAIPMDINDRSFGGEVSYRQTFSGGGGACGPTDAAIGGPNGAGCVDTTAMADAQQLIGSSGVLVAPGIKAQYLDEIVTGAQFQLAPDLMLGITFQKRWLGRVIEDVSTDGAQTYVIANPGEWSADEERKLNARIMAASDPAVRERLQNELELYKGIRGFDKPVRDYASLELAISKRLSKGLFVQASYTFSRTEGNFPGSVSYDNGQLDPNISSQYDLIELLANRRGRLPQDRPHSMKVDAYYTFDLGKRDLMTVGARLRAVSGIPRNALGAHYLYGPDESFLLPRGQFGRTELEHSADIKLSYGRKLSRGMMAELYVDVFNLMNQQGTFDVDATYAPAVRRAFPGQGGGTSNNVNPISGGTYSDLIFAKAIDGQGVETSTPTARNPNFQRTASRYAPASAQVGFRLTF